MYSRKGYMDETYEILGYLGSGSGGVIYKAYHKRLQKEVVLKKIKRKSRDVSANVLGMIGFSCYILADTFFIARGIGSDALAALNLVLPAYSLLNGTGLMIGMGGGSRYSLSSTHPEGETHRTVFTQSVLLAVIAAIFFALTGLLGAEPL